VDSWRKLEPRMDLILWGWEKCCLSLYNVHDREKRIAAVTDVAANRLDNKHVPEEEEIEADFNSDISDTDDDDDELLDIKSTDDEKDELDVSIPIPDSTRKSTRKRKQATSSGYMVNSQQLAMSGDSS